MPQIDATLSPSSDLSKKLSKARNEDANTLGFFTQDANAMRPIEFYYYIHNLSPKTFEVRMPPIMPRVLIPARAKDARVSPPIRIPNIVQQFWTDADTGEIRTSGTLGSRVCMNIINPANMGTDQDAEIDPMIQQFQSGGDLSVWGVFYSTNEVPTEEEIEKHTKRMEKHYRGLIADAENKFQNGQRALISEDAYMAAEHFRHKAAWNHVVEIPESCPLCGGAMKKNAIIHGGADGCGGILDWDKAIQAGLKTEKDRPKPIKEI